MSIKYRPEIDGLRAIAVIAVILYHAEFSIYDMNPFPGGFIGVDIFFVISGYLITSIILREMNAGAFSFSSFYERRARRILPALFTVIAASIPFAWIYMLAKPMKEYAGSVLSSLVFGSNFWFWLEDSYTAEPSALKPFLHTWSLSVEEQFYVLFPLLLLLLWRFARPFINAIFCILFLLSLQLAQYGSAHFTDAAFFLMPTRIWELLAGAILAKLEINRGRGVHPALGSSLPTVGLILVSGSLLFFNDHLQHPSYITLIPVIGTMLLIRFCNEGEWVTRILGSKLFVAIGLISYSLYLWHFPLFAFARSIIPVGLTEGDKLKLILATVMLAVLTYFLIEKPARNKLLLGRRTFLTIIFLSGISIALILGYAYKTDGADFRLKDYEKSLSEYNSLFTFQINNTVCFEQDVGKHCKKINAVGAPTIVLLGDSHAFSLARRLYEETDNLGWNYIQLTMDGCLPIPGIGTFKLEKKVPACSVKTRQIYDYLYQLPPSTIVMSMRFPMYFSGEGFYNPVLNIKEKLPFTSSVSEFGNSWTARTIRTELFKLKEHGHHIIIVEPTPEFGTGVPQYVVAKLREEKTSNMQKQFKAIDVSYPKEIYINRRAQTDEILAKVFDENIAVKLKTEDLFCDDIACYGKDDEWVYYADDDHLNYYGSKRVIQRLMLELEKIYSSKN